MIRYLKETEKYKSRELWEEAFPEDSKSFDDYYLTKAEGQPDSGAGGLG